MQNSSFVPKTVQKNKSKKFTDLNKEDLFGILKKTNSSIYPLNLYSDEKYSNMFNDIYVIVRQGELVNQDLTSKPVPIDNKKINLVSKRYKLINHQELFSNIISILEQNDIDYSIPVLYVDQKENRNGVYGMLTLNDIGIDVDGSLINPTIDIYNSTDGKASAGVFFSAYRQICSNGMRMGVTLNQKFKKMVHTPSIIEKFNFQEIYEQVENEFLSLSTKIEKMQSIKLKKSDFAEFKKLSIDNTFLKHYDNILDRYMLNHSELVNKDTLWGFYATATNYISNHLMLKEYPYALKQHQLLRLCIDNIIN